jgi:hypothetical protein
MKEQTRIPLLLPDDGLGGTSGFLLRPGDALVLRANLPGTPYPVRRRLRVVAEVDVFWRLRCENGIPIAGYRSIVNSLDSREAFRERYALKLTGDRESWPRNAYVKVMADGLGDEPDLIFSVNAKGSNFSAAGSRDFGVELGIYRHREDRKDGDVFDAPDEVILLKPPEGTYPWQQIARAIHLPPDLCALLVRAGGSGFTGSIWLSTPRLHARGRDTLIPPFAPENPGWAQLNWLGENLSRVEWPELEIDLDGRAVFSGPVFNAIFRSPDFEIPLPDVTPGTHEIRVLLKKEYLGIPPLRVFSAEILQESARACEVVFCPPYPREGESFTVLVERNLGGKASLEVVEIVTGEARDAPRYSFDCGGLPEELRPVRVVRRADDGITLSTGDAVYIPQVMFDFSRYLAWYVSNEAGNSMCFRPAYRWSGTRAMNPEVWQWIRRLLERLGMSWHLMVDGRELPGCNANPPEELLAGRRYLGRQSHENDGAFCYWGARREDALFADIFARSIDPGGISPACRPAVREGDRVISYFDPLKAQTMREAAAYFVENLRSTRASSTRHTGPSTLFRYFFQAGYQWLGAEQMYGPEGVILSSLRGACRAYGRKDYGAHLAVQWSSIPHDSPAHARRYFLSLAECYLHGVSNINTEEGLWRMESEYAPHDRFSRACTIHREQHRRFYRFLQTHERRGELRVPIAVVQGRFCGWRCFGRGNVWGSHRPEFAFAAPEESFDLLSVFYPRSRLDAIYRNPCPDDQPQGWYSGTPYGPVDLLPLEAPRAVLKSYSAIAFLGWNTFSAGDFRRLLAYVKQGGTLILGRPHISTETVRGRPSRLPETSVLTELIGKDLLRDRAAPSLRSPCIRGLGKGRVVYFPWDAYPSEPRVRPLYERELRKAAGAAVAQERCKGWIEGSHDVGFAAYDWPADGLRTLYVLNIDWWSGAPTAPCRLLLGDRAFPIEARAGTIETITVAAGVAVMPLAEDADVFEVSDEAGGVRIAVQSDRGTELLVFEVSGNGSTRRVTVEGGGPRTVSVPHCSRGQPTRKA